MRCLICLSACFLLLACCEKKEDGFDGFDEGITLFDEETDGAINMENKVLAKEDEGPKKEIFHYLKEREDNSLEPQETIR